MRRLYIFIFFILVATSQLFAQFGQNKVQHKDLDWFYIQTKHFDIYYTYNGERIAEFTASEAEYALERIQNDVNFKVNNRISLIVYNSHNDFQETNVTDEYTSQGVGGFTEPFKNRVVFPFEGSYQKFEHVIYHELVHAVMRDMYYGGTIQNIVAKGITLQLPQWFWEGSAEFLSQDWETNSDMFIRNAIISEVLPDVNNLDGYLSYRGGQAVFKYISDTYGRKKIAELMSKTQNLGNLDAGMKASIGVGLKEFNERWKKSIKKEYWPDIARMIDPDEFAKRLTDNKEDGGFYNTSPTLSPQGDKIAFITDRDIFLKVYLMNAQDGKIIKSIISSGQTTNFEELNLLHPSLTWAPDNKKIALSFKKGGSDIINIIDTETEDVTEIPIQFDGIESVSWSPDGDKIAFCAQTPTQSDIYVYNLKTESLSHVTNDIFSDNDPSWSPDSKYIVFSSDRGSILNEKDAGENFNIFNHNYKQLDLYVTSLEDRKIFRLTDWELSDEKYAVFSSDGKEILFVSDYNGINNIYRRKIDLENPTIEKSLPITNSISEVSQISISQDGKKLVFTSLYNMGYNIYLLNNPFDMSLDKDTLELTGYMNRLRNGDSAIVDLTLSDSTGTIASGEKSGLKESPDSTSAESEEKRFYTGKYISKKEPKTDSTKVDYTRYIFGVNDKSTDSTLIKERQVAFKETLDDEGNFLVNKYRTTFTPDLIYANAGYSTLYGLLGTTVLSFSDMLGNHRIVGMTSLQIDIKNSDYGLAYYYLKNRLDVGFEFFHTARFVYLSGYYGSELNRFRNFGGVFSLSYPLDRFYRLEGSLSLLSVTSDNLDNISAPSDKATYIVPSVSFVKDNILWGYYSPIQGTRYKFTLFGDPGFTKARQSFYSFVWDFRNYMRFWYDNSFVLRLSGGYSGGANPQRFFLGGTENWINRTFATGDIPVNNASDFAFLSPAMPMRGFNYAEQIGTKYTLLNLELRMPLIRYLVTGPLPILFQNILGAAFIDAGSAWNNTKSLQLIGRNTDGNIVTKDLLLGGGFGARMYFIFLWRFDVAWTYDLDRFSQPKYYISIGLDF
ncbi:MAG: biopolymer transporter Tol [Melioribacteraceae bacterium]